MLWRSYVNINILSLYIYIYIDFFVFERALPPPSTSPFFAGGPTRITASTFQPFNPRYRSPNSRATTAAQLNARRSISPPNTNQSLPNSLNRPTRRFGNNN